ncbi:hypothetical protein SAMN05192575_101525 [Nocardioides alpinus]|uniref:DUF998 domain-containing protein n=1 Tax=Nocardioides alpinus TaxID=748909 RepID=A0A1I0VXN5_9ACTN|nr:hypothetical protein [Nocardioides alpinus]PKH37535.1 hypothetical protein CXG46_19020 [Nocardioides alpinus]SFA80837.1 hypothetical protein SAMN05192575_101525 [Nocardioides alpinus]
MVASSPTRLRSAVPALLIALGGLAMIALWIPFTLAHGPTSYDEERVVGGMTMIGWGFLLGVVPNVLVGVGLVVARSRLRESRGRARALAVVVAALLGSALLDLAFLALGPPFSIFLLAPATLALAVLSRGSGLRWGWALLATAYFVALGLLLVPQATSDGFGGFRIYGLAAHVGVGLGWVVLAAGIRTSGRDGSISPKGAHTGVK